MQFKNVTVAAVSTVAALFATELVYWIYKKAKGDSTDSKQNNSIKKEINDVIMFNECESAKIHYLKGSPKNQCEDKKSHSFGKIIHYLNSSKETLDVCMYLITSTDITNRLIRLHSNGCKIRVIVDGEMAYASGSQVKRLQKFNIPVRWQKSNYLMHHKFCIIDGAASIARKFKLLNEQCRLLSPNSEITIEQAPKCLRPILMTGSLNWTTQALNGNCDNILVTSQKDLVQKYELEFERLWATSELADQ